MMSKKQWFVLLCILVVYLLIGACVYYEIESREEDIRRKDQMVERKEIEVLLFKHYVPTNESSQEDIFDKLREYCGKPLLSTDPTPPIIWDFYHALFFVITVCTTVGYGNLAPSTPFGRIFMIFYSLIGMPINGLLMVTLGEYFGKTFTKLYNKYKSRKMDRDTTKLSLVAQIALYLIPGFTIFIFIPSIVIMIAEDWAYNVAVYYCFVTLTTIGFGDYVAGVNQAGKLGPEYTVYKVFLLIWIIIGLGYVLMVMGFISRGLRSKKMHAIEHLLSENIKRTPDKFKSLKSVIYELLLERVKPVYKKKSIFIPSNIGMRTCHSCPELRMLGLDMDDIDEADLPYKRRRAISETMRGDELPRIQSDTDLHLIDKELTFERHDENNQSKFLIRVANALGNLEAIHNRAMNQSGKFGEYNGFTDEEILESENQFKQSKTRSRSNSEVKIKIDEAYNSTWYGQSASLKMQEIREKLKHGRARSRTLPVQQEPLFPITQPAGLFNKIKKTFQRSSSTSIPKIEEFNTPRPQRHRTLSEAEARYIERTKFGRPSLLSLQDDKNLETIAELLIAISNLPPENPPPKRKIGTVTPPTPSPKIRRNAIRPAFQSRRASFIPTTPKINVPRRFSLRPSTDNEGKLLPPPAYSPPVTRPRRFSIRPTLNLNLNSPSPVQRQRLRSYREQYDN